MVIVSGGTKWYHKFRFSIEDAHIVKQLRSCGAILVGKTNMHEIGAGTSGINPHYGYQAIYLYLIGSYTLFNFVLDT